MKMNTLTFKRSLAPISLAVALLLAGCADKDPQKMLESARQYLEQNDTPAAIIQLKNALQENPGLAEARFLLGKTLLLSGDVVGAETELLKASEAGYSKDQVTPLLVQSRLAQGKARAVTDDFSKLELASPQANAELKTLVAVAWRQQGNVDAFSASLQGALDLQPDHAPALIEQARFKATQRDFDGALALLDSVLAKSPTNQDGLKLRGDILLYGKGDSGGAMAAYRAAVQASPRNAEAQEGVVRILLSEGKIDEAGVEIEALKKIAPGRPPTLALQTQQAFQAKDFKSAQTFAQQLLKLVPNSPSALELAGVAELQLNALVQAEALLTRAVQAAPQLSMARRALVLTYIRTGQADKALAALPADLATNDRDPALLAVAGQAYMLKGDAEQAQRLFTRAAKLDPKDPGKRTSLAVSQLMLGKTELAMDSLEDIASTDGGVVADMALISAHLGKRDVDKALAAIDALEKKRADDPMPSHLRGRALLVRNDVAGARKAFERALEIDANYFAATAALSVLDVVDSKPAAAQTRLEAEVKRNPKNTQAWLALAELRARDGGTNQQVVELLNKAVDASPTDKAPRLALIEQHLRQNDAKSALTAAQTAVAALPDVPELIDVLGRAQSANAEYNQALSSFNKLAGLMPQSPLPHLRLASVHVANKNPSAAGQSLRKALEIQPNLLPAQVGLAELALKDGKPAAALAISQTVQKQRPKESAGFALEGDVHAASKNWASAAAAYRTGLALAPAPDLVIKLHTALGLGGKAADADRVAADWLKASPKDAAVPLYLGDRAITSGKLPDAARHYERVIELQPKNALALNNLAWIAGKLGRPDAVSLAERANEAVPNQPAFMDTLAMLLSEKGEHAKALDLQKKAIALNPEAPVFKLNMAKIHLAAGEKAAARTLLNELSALGDKFSGQAEVADLKQRL